MDSAPSIDVPGSCNANQPTPLPQDPSTSRDNNRDGWQELDNANNNELDSSTEVDETKAAAATEAAPDNADESAKNTCKGGQTKVLKSEVTRDLQEAASHCENAISNGPSGITQTEMDAMNTFDSTAPIQSKATESVSSMRSIGSFSCRICQNAEQPEKLVSPCNCKGTLTYVHVHCLEHWISTSGKTMCELCQFQYKTLQTLRYTCLQSLRMWYSHSMSRRALQEDCQMFSLLTLVALGIVGTLLVGLQHYIVQEKNSTPTIAKFWTKSWLLFFLFSTFTVYFVNVYMIAKGQLTPWYRWWQSAREIKLILENRKTDHLFRKLQKPEATDSQDAYQTVPIAEEEEVTVGTVLLNYFSVQGNNENDGRRHALVPRSTGSLSLDDTSTTAINNQHPEQERQEHRPQNEQEQLHDRQQQDNRNHVVAPLIDV